MKDIPTLLADAMLGRLAKWLRLLGYDTLYDSALSDHQIAARARAEARIVLTRDRELARRKGFHRLLVRSDLLEEQMREVVTALGAPPPEAQPRCPQCNASLSRLSPDQVRSHVPAHVVKTHRRFHHCPECDKYYWPGSHWRNIQSVIARVFADLREGQTTACPGDDLSDPSDL
jgi:uncharacterized protein with PIN domain